MDDIKFESDFEKIVGLIDKSYGLSSTTGLPRFVFVKFADKSAEQHLIQKHMASPIAQSVESLLDLALKSADQKLTIKPTFNGGSNNNNNKGDNWWINQNSPLSASTTNSSNMISASNIISPLSPPVGCLCFS